MFEKRGELYIFKYGKKAYEKAISAAKNCQNFILDKDEDELVTSLQKESCYNCLFRRWTKDSFSCHKIG